VIILAKPKCLIEKYKSSKHISGDQLLLHKDFHERVKKVESVAKECHVHVYVKGSYFQLQHPSEQVLVSDADLVIGLGFQFELRDENNAMLCNKLCLSTSKQQNSCETAFV
jgi:hypothetical protein